MAPEEAGSARTLAEGGHLSLGPSHHVGQVERLEVGAHVLADIGPHGEQDALALVVAGAVLVGEAEVAGHDGAVDGGDDLGKGDLLGRTGQYVATPHAALGAHQTGARQRQEDCLLYTSPSPRDGLLSRMPSSAG